MVPFPDLLPALPEIVLACSGMALLIAGVFRGDEGARPIAYTTMAAMLFTLILVVGQGDMRGTTFNGLFVVDGFAVFMKTLVLLASAVAVVMSQTYFERERMGRFELPILMLFATLGMLMMISANDLLSLYVGLETQSLALYVLAASRRDHLKSTEAGLKYFVLGALSSGMLLYGASLIYGFTGSTNFARIAEFLHGGHHLSAGILMGLVFVTAGLAFKVSAVPFHMWTPDVYEGSPTPVTAFFAVAPKVAAIALLIRVLVEPFGDIGKSWFWIVNFLAIASMGLGAFAAITQNNIKRLMAYSSIGHVGYALVGLAAGGEEGIRGILVYMTIYLFMNIGAFAIILCMRVNGRAVEELKDLAGFSRSHPMMALAMAIFMFSMAGIPPLAGFFGKLYIFLAAIKAELYILSVIGVLTSVVSAYYYLRVIKIMYFDEPGEAIDRFQDDALGAVLIGASLFTLLFFIFPSPVLDAAGAAAATLFAAG